MRGWKEQPVLTSTKMLPTGCFFRRTRQGFGSTTQALRRSVQDVRYDDTASCSQSPTRSLTASGAVVQNANEHAYPRLTALRSAELGSPVSSPTTSHEGR